VNSWQVWHVVLGLLVFTVLIAACVPLALWIDGKLSDGRTVRDSEPAEPVAGPNSW
jgi:hypothetical protein